MVGNVNYSYCEKEVVLIKSYVDLITVRNLLHSWLEVKALRMITSNVKGIMSDFRGCQFEIEEEDLNSIFDFMEQNIHLAKNIKLAIVLDSPKVALVILFKRRFNINQIQIFNSKKAAIDWIYKYD